MFTNKKAISTALVGVVFILVLGSIVSIALAIVLSGWSGVISSSDADFATIGVEIAYAMYNNTNWNGSACWTVKIELRNSGSADTDISNLHINGKSLEEYSDHIRLITSLPLCLHSGQKEVLVVELEDGKGFIEGMIIEVKLFSSSGASVTKQIDLR